MWVGGRWILSGQMVQVVAMHGGLSRLSVLGHVADNGACSFTLGEDCD